MLDGFDPPYHKLHIGRRTVVYLGDAAALVAHVMRKDGGNRRQLMVRPTNLEDVFLALTGTSLEEGQP